MLPFRLVYHEGYDLNLGDHVFPSQKFEPIDNAAGPASFGEDGANSIKIELHSCIREILPLRCRGGKRDCQWTMQWRRERGGAVGSIHDNGAPQWEALNRPAHAE